MWRHDVALSTKLLYVEPGSYLDGVYHLSMQPPNHNVGVDKSSTSFGWGKGGNVTYAGWQVTLCDPVRHVSSHSGG